MAEAMPATEELRPAQSLPAPRLRLRVKTPSANWPTAVPANALKTVRKRPARCRTSRQNAIANCGIMKARRPYALYFQEFSTKEGVTKGKGLPKSAVIDCMKRAAAAWRDLPAEEKEEYKHKCQEECIEQRSQAVAHGIFGRTVHDASDPIPPFLKELAPTHTRQRVSQ